MQNSNNKKRDLILNGNIWKTIISISLPLVLYNLCNYIYTIFDMMIIQKAGIGSAADIVVLDQIKGMLTTLGSAFAGSGGILIARKIGQNNIAEAKKLTNTVFSIAFIISLIMLIFIPIGPAFLKLLNTDETIILNSINYYNVQILTIFITTLNTTFIAIEKSKGNTSIIFSLNIGVIILKIILTLLFAYGPFENVTSAWLAFATLLAQLVMFIGGVILSFKKQNPLRLSIKDLNLSINNLKALTILAIPLFIESLLFSYGKVYVNSVATKVYGLACVGALGISNTIAGLLSNIINSFKDGSSSIIAQNYGAKNGNRIIKTFYANTFYILCLSVIGTIVLFIFKEEIAVFFCPNDLEQKEIIINIFKWECLDIIFMGLAGSAMALFYGFGKTKLAMILNICTLFAYRIPILLLSIYVFKINYESCGIAMFGSNMLTGIIAFTIALFFIRKLKNNSKYDLNFI